MYMYIYTQANDQSSLVLKYWILKGKFWDIT